MTSDRRGRRPNRAAGPLTALALVLAAPAWAPAARAAAAPADPPREISLPAGSLDQALIALAAQTRQQLLYAPDLVQGRRVAALSGRFTTAQALARLVDAREVEVSFAAPNVVVLRPRAARSAAGPTPAAGAADRPFGGEAAPGGATDLPADAATAALATGPVPPATVAEVQVTGSHIRGGRAASELMVIDRAGLERSGHATVAAALNALPENFGGANTEGTLTTGADKLGRNGSYGTGLNLRALGSKATLVMVNGRRLAGSGAFAEFADVSSIPTAAVDRIEILLDGASALYGADAVGGVVNIILKHDLEGGEARILLGSGTSGEPFQGQASLTAGHRWSSGGLLFAYELQRRGDLPAAARDFTATADLRGLGGHDWRQTNAFPGNILVTDPVRGLVPGFAIPAGQNGVGLRPGDFRAGAVNLGDQDAGLDILPEQTLNAAYLALDQSVGDRLTVTADLRLASRRFAADLAPSTSTFTVTRANPFFVSPNGAASNQIAYSFAGQLPNPRTTGTAETLAATLGGDLSLAGDWRADGYLAFAQQTEEARTRNIINSAYLSEALGSAPDRPETAFRTAVDGFFNPFAGTPDANSATVLGFIGSGWVIARSRARTASAELKADGTVWSLPGGPAKLAVGLQARRETQVRTGASLTSGVAPTRASPTDVSRDVAAVFGELRVPLFGDDNARPGLRRLELTLAGRVERYQAFGSTTDPMAGVLWQPRGDLSVRATWGRSFRAPALKELSDPAFNTPGFLSLGPQRLRVLLLGGGNPGLKPETAETWTAGFDWRPEPHPGARLSLTWFDVRFADRIDRPVQQNVLNALTDPTLAPFVRRISPTTSAEDLALITRLLNDPATPAVLGPFVPAEFSALVDNRYVNTGALRVSGLDLTAAWPLQLGDDSLMLAANGSWLAHYQQQVTPTSATVERLGLVNFPVRFRGRLTADWTRGPLTLDGALNYLAGSHDAAGTRIDSQATVDLQARLAPARRGPFKDVSLLLNVRNVFDKAPPFYDNPVGLAYDPANADPVGRFVSVQLTRAW